MKSLADIVRQGGRRTLAVALWALCVIAPALAETLPQKGTVDPRIRTVAYDPNQVYRLFGYVGYHIDLEFEADETFVDLSGGDLEAVTFRAHDNVLTVKPKAASAEMNLAVTTSKRRYYFEYTASLKRPGRLSDPVMYAVRFTYPPSRSDGKDGPSDAERVNQALAQASRPRNLDYWYCGSRSIRPVAASDDGVQTRITFGAKSELPAIFVRNDDGSESLLNFSIDRGDVLIHRVGGKFILRRGKLTGCVVNKSFVGGGERLESGTVTPDVERERRGSTL